MQVAKVQLPGNEGDGCGQKTAKDCKHTTFCMLHHQVVGRGRPRVKWAAVAPTCYLPSSTHYSKGSRGIGNDSSRRGPAVAAAAVFIYLKLRCLERVPVKQKRVPPVSSASLSFVVEKQLKLIHTGILDRSPWSAKSSLQQVVAYCLVFASTFCVLWRV